MSPRFQSVHGSASRRRIRFRRVACRLAVHFKEENGSGLVEFAITALLLFTVLFGIMDCSRAIYIDLYLANTAREAVRYASVRGASWPNKCSSATAYDCTASTANVSSFVESTASAGITPSLLKTATTWPGTDATGASCTSPGSTNSLGCVVKITVTYPFTFSSPLLPDSTYVLTSTSEGTIAQ